MINRMKSLPHKFTFAIGLTLLLVGYIISDVLPFSIWSILIGGTSILVGILFIALASDKKRTNINK